MYVMKIPLPPQTVWYAFQGRYTGPLLKFTRQAFASKFTRNRRWHVLEEHRVGKCMDSRLNFPAIVLAILVILLLDGMLLFQIYSRQLVSPNIRNTKRESIFSIIHDSMNSNILDCFFKNIY